MFAQIVCFVLMTSLHLSAGDKGLLPFPEVFEDKQEGVESYLSYMDPAPCGYVDLARKYDDACKKTYLENIFKTKFSDGIITGQKLLERISVACSNYESYRRCSNCTAKRDCPEQRSALFESLIGKWSIFCNGDQVADWLPTIFQSGYRYNESCDYVYDYAFYNCLVQTDFGDGNYTAFMLKSLSEGLSDYRTFVSSLCTCSVSEILTSSEYVQMCGSSWQDILLTQWLKLSTYRYLGIQISEVEVKMLQTMRC